MDDHTVNRQPGLVELWQFYNLAENGIKYNKENGSVTVTAKKYKMGKAEILSEIQEQGIPNEMKNNKFSSHFSSVDKSQVHE